MNLRTIDGSVSCIPLGLHIDPVEPEWVLADDAIDACVAGGARTLDRPGAPVAHCFEKRDNKVLEAHGRQTEGLLEDLSFNGGTVLVHGSVNKVLRRGRLTAIAHLDGRRVRGLLGSGAFPKLSVGGIVA